MNKFQIPVEKQSLRRSVNEQWVQIDDKQTLQEQGFSPKNARADEPAVLALVIPGLIPPSNWLII